MSMISFWRHSLFYLFYFAFVGAFSPYFSLYLQSLHFTALQIAVIMSLLQVTRIFAPNAWGWLSDHTAQPVMIMRLASFFSVVAYCGVFFGASFYWLFAVIAVMGFFWSGPLPLVEAITLNRLGEHPQHYGRIRLWGSVGFIAAVLSAGWALDRMAIGGLLWITLGLQLGIFACSYLLPPSADHAHEEQPLPVWQVMRQPTVLALFFSCFLMIAAHGPLNVFYSIYLVEHGYSKTAVGALWALGVVAEIIAFLYLPTLFRRFGLRRLMILSFALAVPRFLLIGWGVAWVGVLVFAQLLHALTFATCHAAAVAAVHRMFPGRLQGRGQALYTSFSFGLGGTLGGLYSGFFWERIGAGATFTIGACLALIGLAVVMAKLRLEES